MCGPRSAPSPGQAPRHEPQRRVPVPHRVWGRHGPRVRLGGANPGGRGWPDGRGLGAPGLSVSRGGRRAPLTFSSTQLTMIDGYLRLSQRKNAGTPITAPGWRRRRGSPWTNATLETDRSGGRGHGHFRPRVHRRQEVMSRGAAGEAGKPVGAVKEVPHPPRSCRGCLLLVRSGVRRRSGWCGLVAAPSPAPEVEHAVAAAPSASLRRSPPGWSSARSEGLWEALPCGFAHGTISVQSSVKASLFVLPGLVHA